MKLTIDDKTETVVRLWLWQNGDSVQLMAGDGGNSTVLLTLRSNGKVFRCANAEIAGFNFDNKGRLIIE